MAQGEIDTATDWGKHLLWAKICWDVGLGHKVDAKDINRQRFNRALSEWTKLERTSLCTRTVQGIAVGLRRRAYMYQCRIPGRVERVPTEYNIADVHSKPTNGVVLSEWQSWDMTRYGPT